MGKLSKHQRSTVFVIIGDAGYKQTTIFLLENIIKKSTNVLFLKISFSIPSCKWLANDNNILLVADLKSGTGNKTYDPDYYLHTILIK